MIDKERQAVLIEALRGHSVAVENITDEYREYLKLSEREELEIDTEGGRLKFYIFTAKNRKDNCPVYINVHGGGFVRPHQERDEIWSSKAADSIQGISVDVDYSLAPEYPYPTAFLQTYDLVKWVFANAVNLNADPEKIFMGGYSAGANLTAAVCLKANVTSDFRLRAQILGYGAFDMVTDPADKPFAETNMIPVERGRMFSECYTANDPSILSDPYCSPLLADEDMVTGMPEALIIAAGKDNFKYENAEYAKKLFLAGVKVTMKEFVNSNHGFIIHCTEEWEEGQKLIIDYLNSLI